MDKSDKNQYLIDEAQLKEIGYDEESPINNEELTNQGMSFKQKLIMSGLMIWITLTSSTMGILGPILVTYFKSDYFVVFTTSFEFFIFFGLLYLFSVKKKVSPPEKCLIVQLGIFNALMAMSLLYASDPTRTPPVMQSTLTGLAVLPSAIMRRLTFGKDTQYHKVWTTLSCLLLLASLVLSGIPMVEDWSTNENDMWSILWCFIYLFGVCTRSYYNVIQEKYVRRTEYAPGIDLTFKQKFNNKIILSFFSRIIMICMIMPMFGFDWIGKNITQPLTDFNESFYEGFTTVHGGLLLQGFIVCYFTLFFSAIYLNAISTNYHMILTAIANPTVALFFTIFPDLNPGIKYPWWIVILSLLCGIVSVAFWIKGESKIKKK